MTWHLEGLKLMSQSFSQFSRVSTSRELVALHNLSSWCLVMVERLFLAVPWGCLRFVIVVFPDHTHLLFLCLSVASLSQLAYQEQDTWLCRLQINRLWI